MRAKPRKNKHKTQGQRRNVSSVKLAFLALGLLIGVLVLGRLVNFVGSLTKPFSQDLLIKKHYTWDGNFSINIAFKSDNVWLLHFDPAEKAAYILKIPDETYMELPGSYGSWRVGAIYDLGQEEKPQIGSELLKESLAKLVGLPVDGFITVEKGNSVDNLEDLILSWHRSPLNMLNFLRQIKTDLTPFETFRFLSDLSKIRADKLTSLNIEQSDITKSLLLPDSSRVLGIDYVNLDLFIRENMSDEKISREETEVAIFNATAHPGLAMDVKRIVTNLGANTIIVSNSEFLIKKSLVLSDQRNDTFVRMSQIFAPWCLKSKCSSPDPKIVSSRADVSIILGEDFYNRFSQLK